MAPSAPAGRANALIDADADPGGSTWLRVGAQSGPAEAGASGAVGGVPLRRRVQWRPAKRAAATVAAQSQNQQSHALQPRLGEPANRWKTQLFYTSRRVHCRHSSPRLALVAAAAAPSDSKRSRRRCEPKPEPGGQKTRATSGWAANSSHKCSRRCQLNGIPEIVYELRRLVSAAAAGQLFGQAPAPPMWRRSPTERAAAIGRAARLHFRPRKPGASLVG